MNWEEREEEEEEIVNSLTDVFDYSFFFCFVSVVMRMWRCSGDWRSSFFVCFFSLAIRR